MLINAPWPELDDLYGYVAGILVEPDGGQYRARGHLPVVRARDGGHEVCAHPIGPTFHGRARREAFDTAERWVLDYLKGAYGVHFRPRKLESPDFGPGHFTGVLTNDPSRRPVG